MMNKSLLLSLASLSAFVNAADIKKPNIIVILADDLGYGDVSSYGAKTIQTPNIDRLANEGVRFTQGYATSATSTPSRYALMTGMYPWKNPDAKILPGDAPLLVSERTNTLPKMMQQAGYATGAIGKWHLGMGVGNTNWNEQITPSANTVGFDYTNLIAATNDRVPTVYVENGFVVGLDKNDPISVSYKKNFDGEPTALTNPELMTKVTWDHGHNHSVTNGVPRIGFMKGGKSAIWKDEDMADYFIDRVKEFLNANQENPFFLYYGLHQPHVPRIPNARFEGKSGMGPRGDVILEADWCVGELLKTLENMGILENTLIIFSSDNGPVLNDGYKDDAVEKVGNHTPAGALRGGKYSLFEAGTRVPFMVYWKGKVSPIVSDAMVCQLDLYASIASLIGAQAPKGIDSQNLLPVFLGKSNKGRKELIIEAQSRLAYRSGKYALIPPYKGKERNETQNEVGNLPEWSLYDLSTDLGQRTNIANSNPKLLTSLKNSFIKLAAGHFNENATNPPLE